jgi:GST-like protein
MIELYTSPTPNGYKASVTLEELDMDYNVHVINLQQDEQKTTAFLAMNPNGRIPVIVDPDFDNLAIFESGLGQEDVTDREGSSLLLD